jgi:hypothetical protein
LVPLNAEFFDIGSNFNTGTYTFIAPVNGIYLFQGTNTYSNLQLAPVSYDGDAMIRKNGTTVQEQSNINFFSDNGDAAQFTQTWIIQLVAGDAIQYWCDCKQRGGGAKTVSLFSNILLDRRTVLSGALLS